MVDLLLEIGTEEIPARFVEEATASLLQLLRDSLERERVTYSSMEACATPRRLAVFVYGIAPRQKDTIEIKYGPPLSVAFDQGGRPTKAAIAFARAQGVSVEELRAFEREGKRFVGVEIREEGKDVREVLPAIVGSVIPRIPFSKKMRWGEGIEFARPIRWLLCLLDGTVLPVSIGGIQSGPFSFGHRLLSKGKVFVEGVKAYKEVLRKAYVIVDDTERLKMIEEGVRRIEREINGRAIYDEALLKEILYITEYPFPIVGRFDEGFLSLPKEVIMNVMRAHQRYIPLERDGVLLPRFLCFANTLPKDEALIRKGNEKVLRARLEDAKFYFDEDRKVRLDSLYEGLEGLIFHSRVGTMKDKVERVRVVAEFLAERLGYEHTSRLQRALRLMKADLLTHMVREFPELQGKMGAIYARLQGEEEEVARAIEEHYLPSSKQDEVPKTRLGTILSMADKMDTLCSFFSRGIVPSSDKDPFGLRRQALGLLRILVEGRMHVDLESLADVALGAAGGDGEVREEVLEFLKGRLRFYLVEEGRRKDLVEAILPYAEVDPYEGVRRLACLEERTLDLSELLVGFKRVYNMTKGSHLVGEVEEGLFEWDEERELYSLLKRKEDEYRGLISKRDFHSAISILLGFKAPIDRFFEKVFVMVEDRAIRENRLKLLGRLRDMFLSFADFSKIEMEGERP